MPNDPERKHNPKRLWLLEASGQIKNAENAIGGANKYIEEVKLYTAQLYLADAAKALIEAMRMLHAAAESKSHG